MSVPQPRLNTLRFFFGPRQQRGVLHEEDCSGLRASVGNCRYDRRGCAGNGRDHHTCGQQPPSLAPHALLVAPWGSALPPLVVPNRSGIERGTVHPARAFSLESRSSCLPGPIRLYAAPSWRLRSREALYGPMPDVRFSREPRLERASRSRKFRSQNRDLTEWLFTSIS